MAGVGTKKHIIGRFFIRLPFFPIPPVLIPKFPSLTRINLPCFEPLELFLWVYVEPKFDQDRPGIDKFSSISLISR